MVCDRGVVDRVDKSAEVKRVGGKGMVLVNLTANSVDGDTHAVPTVHLNVPYGPAVKAYAKKSGAKATLREGNLTLDPDQVSADNQLLLPRPLDRQRRRPPQARYCRTWRHHPGCSGATVE